MPLGVRLSALALLSLVPTAGGAGAYQGRAQILELGARLGAKLAAKHRGPVAVVAADRSLGPTRLGDFLQEDFADALQRRGLRVVERSHLALILREKKLDSSGLIDPLQVRELGRWTSARVLVHFVVVPLDQIQVRAVAWDVDTSERLIGDLTSLPRFPELVKLLPPEERKPPPPDPKPAAVTAHSEIRYELQSCRRSGTVVSCSLALTSRKRDQRVRLSRKSYVQDTRGRIHRASQLHTGKHHGWMLLLQGIKTPVHIDFKGVPRDVRRLPVLRLKGKGLDAEFPGVGIAPA